MFFDYFLPWRLFIIFVFIWRFKQPVWKFFSIRIDLILNEFKKKIRHYKKKHLHQYEVEDTAPKDAEYKLHLEYFLLIIDQAIISINEWFQ